MIEKVASKNKPYFLATGASEIEEVIKAVQANSIQVKATKQTAVQNQTSH